MSAHHITKRRVQGRLPNRELEQARTKHKVEVEAVEQASRVQEELLVQELEQAETTLEVEVEAVEQAGRHLVVVPTTAQARLRPILQVQI